MIPVIQEKDEGKKRCLVDVFVFFSRGFGENVIDDPHPLAGLTYFNAVFAIAIEAIPLVLPALLPVQMVLADSGSASLQ